MLGYLIYKSALVPRAIAVLGLVGGPLLIASVTATLFGLYEGSGRVGVDATLLVAAWEASLGVWLTVKGINPSAFVSESTNPDDGVLTGVLLRAFTSPPSSLLTAVPLLTVSAT